MNAARALCAALALAWLALVPPPARAQMWSTPAQRVLYDGRTPPRLRARLAAHADSVLAHAPLDAGESWYWIGVSHARAGHPDSAAAAFARARALRDMPEDALGQAEALLAAGRPAAADSAAALVAALAPDDPGSGTVESRAWRAWAQAHLAGPQAARGALEGVRAELLAPVTPLALRERWTRRLAPSWRDAQVDAWPLLRDLAVLARGHDAELLRLARAASLGRTAGRTFEAVIAAGIARQDSLAGAARRAAGGRPLALFGADGAALGAWLFPAASRGAPLLALVDSPEDASGESPDSLVARLRRDGVAVALLEPRGSRRSSVPGCALADDWRGREDALTRMLASDLASLVRAAVAAVGCDPRRVAVGAVGGFALAAAQTDDVGPLVLVDPVLAPTDRGPLVDALAAGGMPVYIQTGPASVEANRVVDEIVARVGDPDPRVAEAVAPGHGFALFRAGPAEAKRLSEWLRQALPKRPATPPARRR